MARLLIELLTLLAAAITGAVVLLSVQRTRRRSVKDIVDDETDSKLKLQITQNPTPLLKCIRGRRSSAAL